MRIPLLQIDAFANEPFKGNPAAVCVLEAWLPDATMQAIAQENNLAETAFLVEEPGGWRIRWFTPGCEIDLCGHATLASAFLLFTELRPELRSVTFQSLSGPLGVDREGDLLVLDFPSRPPRMGAIVPGLAEGLRAAPLEVGVSRDILAVLGSEAEVRALDPDFTRLASLDTVGVIATAPASTPGVDFVSRFFAPSVDVGVPEDPVTGSAHCTLIPFWAERLGKTRMKALQVSRRGGELGCELRGGRVRIAGRAVKVLEGHLLLP
ncbi:MAG: PhzF family phenazine biosynthesis protein [Holophagaceae bacterium]